MNDKERRRIKDAQNPTKNPKRKSATENQSHHAHPRPRDHRAKLAENTTFLLNQTPSLVRVAAD